MGTTLAVAAILAVHMSHCEGVATLMTKQNLYVAAGEVMAPYEAMTPSPAVEEMIFADAVLKAQELCRTYEDALKQK